MKRTRDGGAILKNEYGEEVRLSPKEFKRGGMIRDLIRLVIILPLMITYGFFRNDALGLLTIGVIFFMIGWKLKTGW